MYVDIVIYPRNGLGLLALLDLPADHKLPHVILARASRGLGVYG